MHCDCSRALSHLQVLVCDHSHVGLHSCCTNGLMAMRADRGLLVYSECKQAHSVLHTVVKRIHHEDVNENISAEAELKACGLGRWGPPEAPQSMQRSTAGTSAAPATQVAVHSQKGGAAHATCRHNLQTMIQAPSKPHMSKGGVRPHQPIALLKSTKGPTTHEHGSNSTGTAQLHCSNQNFQSYHLCATRASCGACMCTCVRTRQEGPAHATSSPCKNMPLVQATDSAKGLMQQQLLAASSIKKSIHN